MPRIDRHPDLLIWWNPRPVVRNLESGLTLSGDALAVAVLAFFDRPREPQEAVKSLALYGTPKIRGRVRLLRRLGFLIPEAEARRKRSRIAMWKGNVASALHHSASKDLRYLWKGQAAVRLARERVSRPRPALFKRYRSSERVTLPAVPRAGAELLWMLRLA